MASPFQDPLLPASAGGEAASPDLSVFLPVFNEEGNLGPLAEKLVAHLDALGRTWEVIFVDDGSTDRSFELLTALATREPRFKVVRFRRNYGQTAAMAAGILAARGRILVPMDADLQNDPADIVRLLARLDEGYDVVSGWRKHRQDAALTRTLPSRVANGLISWISGVHLHDYGCSLKAYRREVLSDVRLYGEMHRFIPIYASWQGARVTEVPVTHHARVAGVSKYGLNRIFKVVLDLMVVKFLSSYATKPIYVFGGAALAAFAGGGLAGSYALYLKAMHLADFVQTPLPLLTVTLGMVGVQLLLLGLIAEMLTRTYHESQGKPTFTVRQTLNLEP
ncbi:MAG: glycosyltransferase family 2 protein [Candidatus Sericytochromatia bacterium]|nr:glycosyltransferase family 2 protein [Candidatus Sericytochromatia bacterium]